MTFDPVTIEEYLRDAPEEFLDCRESGHRFEPWSRSRLRLRPSGNMHLLLRPCQHCGAVTRVEMFELTFRKGEVVRVEWVGSKLTYDRDAGYLAPPGAGRRAMPRARVRSERLLDAFSTGLARLAEGAA